MSDAQPVSVENVAKVEVVNPDATKPADKPPVVEKVTETKETTKTSGAPTQEPPPPVVADDRPRQLLAVATVLQFLALVGFIIWLAKPVDNAQMMILGAEVSFMTTVLNYFFGSSSGSTAKSALLEKK